MTNTAKELRKHCIKLYNIRSYQFIRALSKYLQFNFLDANRPWRAIYGNKRGIVLKLHPTFISFGGENEYNCPHLSEKEFRQQLTELGFIVLDGKNLSITVPACETKGQKLTFAQQWVRDINNSYAKYVARENRHARELFNKFVSELKVEKVCNAVSDKDYTFFSGYKLPIITDPICRTRFNKLLCTNGIKECTMFDCFQNRNVNGLKVMHYL